MLFFGGEEKKKHSKALGSAPCVISGQLANDGWCRRDLWLVYIVSIGGEKGLLSENDYLGR